MLRRRRRMTTQRLKGGDPLDRSGPRRRKITEAGSSRSRISQPASGSRTYSRQRIASGRSSTGPRWAISINRGPPSARKQANGFKNGHSGGPGVAMVPRRRTNSGPMSWRYSRKVASRSLQLFEARGVVGESSADGTRDKTRWRRIQRIGFSQSAGGPRVGGFRAESGERRQIGRQ